METIELNNLSLHQFSFRFIVTQSWTIQRLDCVFLQATKSSFDGVWKLFSIQLNNRNHISKHFSTHNFLSFSHLFGPFPFFRMDFFIWLWIRIIIINNTHRCMDKMFQMCNVIFLIIKNTKRNWKKNKERKKKMPEKWSKRRDVYIDFNPVTTATTVESSSEASERQHIVSVLKKKWKLLSHEQQFFMFGWWRRAEATPYDWFFDS